MHIYIYSSIHRERAARVSRARGCPGRRVGGAPRMHGGAMRVWPCSYSSHSTMIGRQMMTAIGHQGKFQDVKADSDASAMQVRVAEVLRRHQTSNFRKRATSGPAEGPARGLDFARHV